MPTAAEIRKANADKAKATPKILLANLESNSDFTGSSVQEVDRFSISDAFEAEFEFGKVFLTKASMYKDGAGNEVQGEGGKPMVYMTLPKDIAAKYEITKPDILVAFHSSAKEILTETKNKLSKRMDVVEIKNDEDIHSFLITATGSTLTGKTTLESLAD